MVCMQGTWFPADFPAPHDREICWEHGRPHQLFGLAPKSWWGKVVFFPVLGVWEL
eukprot:NODE_1223_length_1514_cov_4.784300_g1018_i0.p6 GENE.NODE_1223_length_1514_cov_4.784300_g1018_i0~~NODE_1223_length_1514_cov_4.784300_g1018_i0.p6  ORF type:complete len:55 (-),score=2.76 NODE_1223_length_1514_cov_4.784300_g1018_i0:106-270(-)